MAEWIGVLFRVLALWDKRHTICDGVLSLSVAMGSEGWPVVIYLDFRIHSPDGAATLDDAFIRLLWLLVRNGFCDSVTS